MYYEKQKITLFIAFAFGCNNRCFCNRFFGSCGFNYRYTENDYHLLEKYLTNYDMTKYEDFDYSKYDINGDKVVDLKDLFDLGEKVFGIWSGRY